MDRFIVYTLLLALIIATYVIVKLTNIDLPIPDVRIMPKFRTVYIHGKVKTETFVLPLIVTEDEIYIKDDELVLTHDMVLEKIVVKESPDVLSPFRLGVSTPLLDNEAKAFSRQRLAIGYYPVSVGRIEGGILTDLHSVGVGVGYRTRNLSLGGYYMVVPETEVGLYVGAKIF